MFPHAHMNANAVVVDVFGLKKKLRSYFLLSIFPLPEVIALLYLNLCNRIVLLFIPLLTIFSYSRIYIYIYFDTLSITCTIHFVRHNCGNRKLYPSFILMSFTVPTRDVRKHATVPKGSTRRRTCHCNSLSPALSLEHCKTRTSPTSLIKMPYG